MTVLAFSGDIVTGVADRTPGGVCNERSASTAIVMSNATAGDANATSLDFTPGESAIANAKAGLAVVVVGADRRDVVALVGPRAPGSVGFEGQTVTAVVIGETT